MTEISQRIASYDLANSPPPERVAEPAGSVIRSREIITVSVTQLQISLTTALYELVQLENWLELSQPYLIDTDERGRDPRIFLAL